MNKIVLLALCSFGLSTSVFCAEEKLSRAIDRNQVQVVRSLLDSELDITVSPAHFASVKSRSMARLLMSSNSSQKCMRACGMAAIKNNWKKLVYDLIGKQGLAFSKKRAIKTLAIVAARYNRCTLMKYFASKDKDVPARSIRGNYTPLHEAAKRGNLKMVKVLVEHCNVPINPLFVIKRQRYCLLGEGHGRTPLHSAIERGHHDVVRYLLRKGAKADIKDGNGNTPRMLAKKKKCSKMSTIFDEYDRQLEHASVDDGEQKSTRCPKVSATAELEPPRVDCTTEAPCQEVVPNFSLFVTSSSSQDSSTNSPTNSSVSSGTGVYSIQDGGIDYGFAYTRGSANMPELSIDDQGMDLFLGACTRQISTNSQRKRPRDDAATQPAYKRHRTVHTDKTALQIDEEVRMATVCGDIAGLSRLLINFPEMILSRDAAGVGLLQLAAANGHHMIFLFLVGLGLRVTDISPDESTLLHWAALGGNSVIISFLLSVGLSSHEKTITGFTPYTFAQINNHTEAAQLLKVP